MIDAYEASIDQAVLGERKGCAHVCDVMATQGGKPEQCAAIIRARGNR